MLGVGLMIGAMVGGWFGFGLGRSGWGSPPEQRADALALRELPAVIVTEGSATARGDAESATSGASGLDPAPAQDPPAASADVLPSESLTASELDATNGRGRSNPSGARGAGARRKASAAEPSSSLAAELAMLQRARRALGAENGRLALGIVQDLDEQFPKGILIEERSATRLLSLCQLERVDEARRVARSFLERYPASVYAERVRRSCIAAPEE
jgi:hypothetical protein